MRGAGAMVLSLVLLISFWAAIGNAVYYSTYYGRPLTYDEMAAYKTNGTTGNCTIEVAPCDKNERRRVDGTCNNLKYPTLGGSHTPYYSMLKPVFNRISETEYEPPLAKSGKPKPNERLLRTIAFSEGHAVDEELTILNTHMAIFNALDVASSQDTSNYVTGRPHCCTAAGKSDYMCVPKMIPPNDPVHRFSGLRCMNQTRPITYQIAGCAPMSSFPSRTVETTPLYDLSPVYGNSKSNRNYSRGLLNVNEYDGTTFPEITGVTMLLGVNFLSLILFWRYHNLLATQLAELNPHWDDDTLFYNAREINIAVLNNIQLYEQFPILMGKEYLIKNKVISEDINTFRDIYDERVKPQLALEYPLALRWVHGMQTGILRMYDAEGNYLKQYPVVNLTDNIEYLFVDSNMASITHGMVKQACGKADLVADSDVVEIGLGHLQISVDLLTNDLGKNRLFGTQDYIKYREFCFGDKIETFEDLIGIISREMVIRMKEVYEHPSDIDFLFGLWVEIIPKGTHFPPTLSCIVAKHMLHNIKSDRHWYERAKRPHPFTLDQLKEVRKVTVARLICDTEDTITKIQPQAFLQPTDNNKVVSCDQIPNLDLTAWVEYPRPSFDDVESQSRSSSHNDVESQSRSSSHNDVESQYRRSSFDYLESQSRRSSHDDVESQSRRSLHDDIESQSRRSSFDDVESQSRSSQSSS